MLTAQTTSLALLSAAMATFALNTLLNFLLFAFICATKINNYFNLSSGLNFGEYYIELKKLNVLNMSLGFERLFNND